MYELHVSARAEVARQRYADAIVESHNRRLVQKDEQVEREQSLGWFARARRAMFAPSAQPTLGTSA